MVGGLSGAVGYGLENRAIKALPEWLNVNTAWRVISPLRRKFVRHYDQQEELNIHGEGRIGKRTLSVGGVDKARLWKKHVEKFLKRVQRLEKWGVVGKNRFLLVVTYSAEPVVETFARDKGVEVIWSYEV
jgi:hypothetical protein